ncbi:hypothetical protein BDQ12DRAFT_675044 [Crucibulum laeve]|uniref:Uncharacterized protein n=1 Tax=Crucibulum laeve TaxID=68775 RepID=A0A5C3MGE0_9AGAR|nr:hypothetical protein BDQ12DRAFT_675044 [Crucibulum laeve]
MGRWAIDEQKVRQPLEGTHAAGRVRRQCSLFVAVESGLLGPVIVTNSYRDLSHDVKSGCSLQGLLSAL